MTLVEERSLLSIASELFLVGEDVIYSHELAEQYLELTGDFEESRTQRLRTLGRFLFERYPTPSGEVLESLYSLALKSGFVDSVDCSGFSLLFYDCILFFSRGSEEYERVYSLTERSLNDALNIDGNEPHTLHLYGLFLYNHAEQGKGNPELALSFFTKAFENDSTMDIACLFKAHCYHDLHQWSKAIKTYKTVNQERLEQEFPGWRVWKLREQIAYCLAFNGEVQEATKRLEEFGRSVDGMSDTEFERYIISLSELEELERKMSFPPSTQRWMQKALRRYALYLAEGLPGAGLFEDW